MTQTEDIIDKTAKSLMKVTFIIHDHVGNKKKIWLYKKAETVATAPLVITGAFWRILDTSKHSAEQHATLTANQQYSTATQLRLVHKRNTQAGLGSKKK